MIVVGIAIMGKSNEPLYLCDCTKILDSVGSLIVADERKFPSDDTANDDTASLDYFGFGLTNARTDAMGKLNQSRSLSMEHQLLIHSSLDRLEEIVGFSKSDGSMPFRRNSGLWLGLLTTLDGIWNVYGYVAATNIKFVALGWESESESSWSAPSPRGGAAATLIGSNTTTTTTAGTTLLNPSSPQEQKIKNLLSSLHDLYVEYVLNPFCDWTEPIQSDKFDRRFRDLISEYCSKEDS